MPSFKRNTPSIRRAALPADFLKCMESGNWQDELQAEGERRRACPPGCALGIEDSAVALFPRNLNRKENIPWQRSRPKTARRSTTKTGPKDSLWCLVTDGL